MENRQPLKRAFGIRYLKARGLRESPQPAVGDGALGFWKALEEEHDRVREERCWVHKTANVLDKLPQSVQPYAKKLIHEMYLSPTKEAAGPSTRP
jgi:transposase-like protein